MVHVNAYMSMLPTTACKHVYLQYEVLSENSFLCVLDLEVHMSKDVSRWSCGNSASQSPITSPYDYN